MSIRDWTEAQLEAFVRQRLNLPENLRRLLASGFLKLASAADRRFALGTATWAMVAAASVDVTVAHGLPDVPYAWAFPNGGTLVHVVMLSRDATNIVFRVAQSDNVARTQSGSFDWFAVS